MIKGTISHHEMEVEHGEELEKIRTGKVPVVPEPDTLRSRLALFIPVAAVFSLVLVGLTYYFLTFETTSITTLPPAERVNVFVRPTEEAKPTGAAPAQGVALAWTGSLENILKEKCTSCHGTMGGFNAETYDEVMKFVEPGSPDSSKIVQAQQGGSHPGQLTEEELNLLVQWIQAGAPKDADGATGGQTEPGTQSTQAAQPGSSETWSTGMETLFTERCGSCHGDSGGFTATTYEDVMKQVTPGDPDNSNVVSAQRAGTHPGQFSEEELNRVIEWIKGGAPQ
jgi:mono/diheme cytochrome c family protein